MDIQIVTDDVPALGLWIGGNHGLQMCQEIGLHARGSARWRQKLSRDDMAAQDERQCSVTHIFEFAPLDFAGSQGESRMLVQKALARRSTHRYSRSALPLVPAAVLAYTSYR